MAYDMATRNARFENGRNEARGFCALGLKAFTAAFSLALVLSLFVFSQSAFALELERVWTGVDSDEMSTVPGGAYNVSLVFDGNVSYASSGTDGASFVEENLAKVYVVDAQGKRVDSFAAKGASSRDEQKVIYLMSSEWLNPVSEYTIVVEAGVRSAHGEVTKVEYRSVVGTTSQTPFGLSIYQVWGIAGATIALFVGILTAIVRKKAAR